ncbi:hypothetical protein BH23GEM4_BH23GEM4_12080 [soil metagenome]
MRVTITVPDQIGEEARQMADRENTSVSAFYADAVARRMADLRRQQAFAAIRDLIGRADVVPDAAEQLKSMRREDDHRTL